MRGLDKRLLSSFPDLCISNHRTLKDLVRCAHVYPRQEEVTFSNAPEEDPQAQIHAVCTLCVPFIWSSMPKYVIVAPTHIGTMRSWKYQVTQNEKCRAILTQQHIQVLLFPLNNFLFAHSPTLGSHCVNSTVKEMGAKAFAFEGFACLYGRVTKQWLVWTKRNMNTLRRIHVSSEEEPF